MSTITTGPADGPPPQLPLTPLSLRRQLMFWTGALLVLIALLWLLGDVLLPFMAGMVLAYLLDPVVRQLQKLGLNRAIASVIIVFVAIGLLALALILILPILGEQIAGFIERMPQYFERLRQIAQDQSQTWLGQMIGEKFPDAQKQFGGVAATAAGWAAGLVGSVLSGGRALHLGHLAAGDHTDRRVLSAARLGAHDRRVDEWMPVPYRETVRGLAREMNGAIAGFVRGQAIVCLILGTFYAVALISIGLNFGLLIGITAAILGLRPMSAPSPDSCSPSALRRRNSGRNGICRR